MDAPQKKAGKAQNSAAPADVAKESRNNHLMSVAGRLLTQGMGLNEARVCLAAINQERYSHGRHPQGPLSAEEMETTIFKSLKRYVETARPAGREPVVAALSSLMTQTIAEPHWVVPGLLPEGLTVLAGKPKMGKSWLGLGITLTCAIGTANGGGLALARYTVEQSSVLYLSLEDSEKRLQSRVQKLLNGRAVPERFHYALNWSPLLSGGLTDLDTWLAATPDTRLVVIDTLAKVRTPGTNSGSMYQEDYALMGALHDLVVKYHVAIVLVHHTRKMASVDTFDEVSGSTGLTGAADTTMVLKRERGQHDAALHVTGRDIEEQELALSFQPASCAWLCTGNVAERQSSQVSGLRQEILDVLREKGEMTPAEMARELGKARDTVKKILLRMKKEGLTSSNQNGGYRLVSDENEIAAD